ncbi:MAG: DNA internalization-related competence protein ComEC/Rec2 [Candidatus Cloacimonetes bacterium]|nr:DNA internalization-related competence protein ComEC/Rec2 [Candidatus Cloacimonadota bacterium]
MKQQLPAPLILPTILWISGIIIARLLEFNIAVTASFIAFFLAISLVKQLRKSLLLIILVLMGMLRFQSAQIKSERHIMSILNEKPQLIQPLRGTIISEIKEREMNRSFLLKLEELSGQEIDGKLLFFTTQDSLAPGDVIETIAEIKTIPGKSNPDSFDYEEFLRSKDIYGTAFNKTNIRITDRKKFSLRTVPIKIRMEIIRRIDSSFGANAGFVKAVILGEKDYEDPRRQTLNQAGLSHLLAVSGLHVGIIYLIFFSLLKIFIRNRKFVRIVIIFLLLLYAGICSWAPSVTRASVMISLFMLSSIWQRKYNSNNILFASLLIITAFDPAQLFSVGLQLSFLAVFTILNIVPRVKLFPRVEEPGFLLRFLDIVYKLAVMSMVLSLILSPLTIYYFNQTSLNGVVGNLLGISLIGIMLPLAMLIISLSGLGFIQELYLNTFNFLLLIFDKWSELSANLPLFFQDIRISLLRLIIIYLISAAIILSIKNNLWNRKYRFLSAIAGTIVIMILLITPPALHDNLEIVFFDCGLGDIIYIKTPENEKIMVDTGPIDKKKIYFDNSALPYLKKRDVKTIDWLIITHAHNDHFGGVSTVFSNFTVKNLLISDEFVSDKAWELVSMHIDSTLTNIMVVTDTLSLPLESVKFKIIHPDKNYIGHDRNNLSIVGRLDYRDLSVLLTGDLEGEGEEYLIKNYHQYLDTDILKVGHHGSKSSTTESFLSIVSPEYAIIFTSQKNRFDFPHIPTLNKLSFLRDNLFVTGFEGAIQVISDGEKADFKTYLTERSFTDYSLDD